MDNKEQVLAMKMISKTFSAVQVLTDVEITLYKGEVHALMGENGAGKSTLMKILCGIHKPDEGAEIVYKGKKIVWKDPLQAKQHGISVIHQELNLSPNLTISENILMGTPFPRNRFGKVKWDAVHEEAQKVLSNMGSNLNPRTLVSSLSVAQQQMVEIARALSYKAEVLIMDEPTASLTDKEIDKLFTIMKDLQKQGVAIVYISHRMDEIFKISDRYTVLRDGILINSGRIEETNPDHLVKQMVGRDLGELFQRPVETRTHDTVSPMLELKKVSDKTFVKDVSIKLYPGEIVGLAGLVGAGRTELIRAIFGASEIVKGEVWVDGKRAIIKAPTDAIALGIGHVPESRKEQGLFMSMSVKENILMTDMKKYRKRGKINWRLMNEGANHFIHDLAIKVASSDQLVSNLSGGNQQKVVIAKWLSIGPKVLLLDEPTRGVDIGAKTEIHKTISELADRGLAVLVVSSELPEIMGVSDRIVVMCEGQITGELTRKEATQEKIMHYATGGTG